MLRTLLPPGDVWPRETDSTLGKFCRGQAEVWARIDAAAWDLVDVEAQPTSTFRMLPEWEAAVGLPDPCVAEPLNIGERRKLLIERLTSEGSQSRAYFIGIAERLGYEVTITEITPFMAGLSQAGGEDQVGPGSISHHWWINVTGYRVTWFRAAVSQAGLDPLARISLATDLECMIRPLQPEHGVLHFSYS